MVAFSTLRATCSATQHAPAAEMPAKYLLVGEGKIDYVKYFRLLEELKYRGPILVEVSAQIHRLPGYAPVKTAEKCYAFLSGMRERALGSA